MPYPITRAYLLRQQKAFWTEKLKPIDSLTSEVEEQTLIDTPLSANQGRVLQANIESEASTRTAADTAINKTISDNNTTYVARFVEDESEIADIQDELDGIVLKQRGFCTPDTATPSSPETGDFWIVSTKGTVFGIAGCYPNDRLIYINSVWNKLSSGKVQSVNGKVGTVTFTAATELTKSGTITATSSAVQPEISNDITQPEFSVSVNTPKITVNRDKDVGLTLSKGTGTATISLTKEVGVSSTATGCDVSSTATGCNVTSTATNAAFTFTHTVANKKLTLTASVTQPTIKNTITQPTIQNTVTQPSIKNTITQPEMSGSISDVVVTPTLTQPVFSATNETISGSATITQNVEVKSTNKAVTPTITISDPTEYSAVTSITTMGD